MGAFEEFMDDEAKTFSQKAWVFLRLTIAVVLTFVWAFIVVGLVVVVLAVGCHAISKLVEMLP